MSTEYQYVKSSNIQGVRYDDTAQVMFVQFVNGSEYAYHGVSEEEYEELLADPSPGSYLNDNIKGTYRFTRV